ncbi:uncharacterized protein [Pagrus major]|uniref:uncharacterized protein n=1 Tax=Pagrus major TaxID=143350 RepID=UPI003CC8B8FD
MTMTIPASQLLLFALLSWNVHCYPVKTVKNGWSQRDPNEGSYTSMEAFPGFYYGSSQSFPAQPSDVNDPAVSFLYEPEKEQVYSRPESYPTNPTPGVSSVAPWNTAPVYSPVAASMTAYATSKTSQPMSDIGLPPPPSLYQAGELERYTGTLAQGSSEMETEELNFVPPPPPPAPYPGPAYQAGELSKYVSISEHGNEERETEEQGFLPPPPYAASPQGAKELSASSTSKCPRHPVSQELGPVGPSDFYLFLTGQLPSGTLSHFQSDYENGRDNYGEVQRYYYPVAQQSTVPTQTQELPSDEVYQQPQYYTKA